MEDIIKKFEEILDLISDYIQRGELGSYSYIALMDDGSGEFINRDNYENDEDDITIFTFEDIGELVNELKTGTAYLDLD